MEITTLREHCGDGEECPGLHRVAHCPDLLFVIAVRVNDAAVLKALGADGVLVGAVPASLLPEVTADRYPYRWARVLPGHHGTVFVAGSVVTDQAAAGMLAPRIGDDEFLMTVSDVALVEV